MSESLIDTAKEIRSIIAHWHPAKQVFTDKVSFRAVGDEVGKSTRQISVSPLKYQPDELHFEETGYMAGGIGAPWLKPVILPEGAEEVRIKDGLITGLSRGTWSRIYNEVEDQVARPIMEIHKGQYRNWLDTGKQPSWVEDHTSSMVTARTEAAWEALSPEQEGVLETGLVALLRCLQEQQ